MSLLFCVVVFLLLKAIVSRGGIGSSDGEVNVFSVFAVCYCFELLAHTLQNEEAT